MSSLIENQPLLPLSPPVPDGRLRSSCTGAPADAGGPSTHAPPGLG